MVSQKETPMENPSETTHGVNVDITPNPDERKKDAGSAAASADDCVVAAERPESSEEKILRKSAFDLDTEDALDAQGASNGLLLSLVETEDNSLSIAGAVGDDDAFITSECRRACLRSMSDLAQVMNLPQTRWFQAVVLFDAYCRRKPQGTDLTHIPSLCVALVKLLKKTDSATISWQGSKFSSRTSQLAQWLQNLGVNAAEGSEEIISQQEQHLLDALGWRVNLPSLDQWLTIFCARFNLFTKMLFVQSLNWVWQQSLSYARWLVLSQRNCPPVPSRRLARGILCMMLINVTIIPLESMRPQKLPASEWHDLFIKSHPQGTVPDCTYMPAHVERILKILQVATGQNLASLQTDCELAVILSKDLLREMAPRPSDLCVNAISDSAQIAGAAPLIDSVAAWGG